MNTNSNLVMGYVLVLFPFSKSRNINDSDHIKNDRWTKIQPKSFSFYFVASSIIDKKIKSIRLPSSKLPAKKKHVFSYFSYIAVVMPSLL